jgi:hypothetical protein
MAISRLPDNQDITGIKLQALPPFKFSQKSEVALQIASHMRRTLELFGTGNPPSLKIPSAMDLAFFYRCSVLDVLDGLFALKTQRYDYSMNGLDSEIILKDPISRRKQTASLRTIWSSRLTDEALKPWNTIKYYAAFPLSVMIP